MESVYVGGNPPERTSYTTDKLDILFVVDNSRRMDVKQRELAFAARRMLEVLEPQCIEGDERLGPVPANGRCPSGSRQFAPLDIHVGVLTSSLGGLGSSTCPNDAAFDNDDHGQLVARAPKDDPIPLLTPERFLAAPGGPALAAATERLIRGVGKKGCGLEAPLESLFQFLNAPDPYESVAVTTGRATYAGVANTTLQQRKAFLRPDSAVLIVILSDEDDASLNPLAVAGSGWAFFDNDFPTSSFVPLEVASAPGRRRAERDFLGGTTAPRGTTACLTAPDSPSCMTCGFRYGCDSFLSEATCAELETDPRCLENGGYCTQEEDHLDIRFQRMKSRYGIEPRFPVYKYATALTEPRIPDRARALEADGSYVMSSRENVCTNPLFAAALPSSNTEELCQLRLGTRPREAVQLVVLTGVPSALLPPNGEPSAAQYRKLVGVDPDRDILEGIDVHMLPSTTPRAGLTTDAGNPDPIHIRDWDTQATQLQLACAWELAEPISTAPPLGSFEDGCSGAVAAKSPICGVNSLVAAGATPGLRHLALARSLGARATVGSICGSTPKASALGDRDYIRSLRAAQSKLWRFIPP